jgi:hypothetical protein
MPTGARSVAEAGAVDVAAEVADAEAVAGAMLAELDVAGAEVVAAAVVAAEEEVVVVEVLAPL